jgi:hypothetical protein
MLSFEAVSPRRRRARLAAQRHVLDEKHGSLSFTPAIESLTYGRAAANVVVHG